MSDHYGPLVAVDGAALRRYRHQRGLTQAALAAMAGTDNVAISRVETGSMRQMRAETVGRLASSLGVAAAALRDMSPRRAAPPPAPEPDDLDAGYTVSLCGNCRHPGGQHRIGRGCRLCAGCPGWDDSGGTGRWTHRMTMDAEAEAPALPSPEGEQQ